jgi:hypothetical protein
LYHTECGRICHDCGANLSEIEPEPAAQPPAQSQAQSSRIEQCEPVAWVGIAAAHCAVIVAEMWLRVCVTDESLQRDHVAEMLGKISSGEISGYKAHRWLGWAQAAIVAAEVVTLEDMKAVNMLASQSVKGTHPPAQSGEAPQRALVEADAFAKELVAVVDEYRNSPNRHIAINPRAGGVRNK